MFYIRNVIKYIETSQPINIWLVTWKLVVLIMYSSKTLNAIQDYIWILVA